MVVNNASARLLGALPPQQYDFKNWDYFQSEVLRFHSTAYPDNSQLIDLVATFRSLMAPDVIQHLGSLVHLHPRYHTTEGANEWLLAVTDALRGRDRTIKDALTAQNWVEDFKKGKVNARHFWTGLDLLASKGEISSDEQRQLFWDAQSWERQGHLLDRCPYFDPSDAVWSSTDAERMLAEQLICRIMVLSKTDEMITKGKMWIVICGVSAALLVLLGTICTVYAIRADRNGHQPDGWIIGAVYSYAIALGPVIPLGIHIYQLRQFQHHKRESRLHERV